jgi:hypothetical protein
MPFQSFILAFRNSFFTSFIDHRIKNKHRKNGHFRMKFESLKCYIAQIKFVLESAPLAKIW